MAVSPGALPDLDLRGRPSYATFPDGGYASVLPSLDKSRSSASTTAGPSESSQDAELALPRQRKPGEVCRPRRRLHPRYLLAPS